MYRYIPSAGVDLIIGNDKPGISAIISCGFDNLPKTEQPWCIGPDNLARSAVNGAANSPRFSPLLGLIYIHVEIQHPGSAMKRS